MTKLRTESLLSQIGVPPNIANTYPQIRCSYTLELIFPPRLRAKELDKQSKWPLDHQKNLRFCTVH